MRKLIESTLVSLDGVIEAPERWATFDAEDTALSLEQPGNYDAFVLGRVTDETFFATWGHTAGNPPPIKPDRWTSWSTTPASPCMTT